LACNNILWTTCTNNMVFDSLIATKLRLPFAGLRSIFGGGYYGQSEEAYYWWSVPANVTSSYLLMFDIYNIQPVGYSNRWFGFSVRCIKN
jgi:hypothetical protein